MRKAYVHFIHVKLLGIVSEKDFNNSSKESINLLFFFTLLATIVFIGLLISIILAFVALCNGCF